MARKRVIIEASLGSCGTETAAAHKPIPPPRPGRSVRITFLAVHFNPAGFKAPVANFRVFARDFERHGGVHVAELVLAGAAPEVDRAWPGVNSVRLLTSLKRQLLKAGLLCPEMFTLRQGKLATFQPVGILTGNEVVEQVGRDYGCEQLERLELQVP